MLIEKSPTRIAEHRGTNLDVLGFLYKFANRILLLVIYDHIGFFFTDRLLETTKCVFSYYSICLYHHHQSKLKAAILTHVVSVSHIIS